jgi:serine phosphatase RsbU (regulator of sigma subunit)
MIDPVGVLTQVPEPASVSWMFNGVRLSRRIIPAAHASRGGDWCEAFVITSDIMALSIGDVCGHGEEKFDAMVATRQAIRDAACRGLNPAEALAEAHRFLRVYDPDEYATALFGLLTISAKTLVFANAGHPAPLLAGPHATVYLEYPDSDLPLGIEARYMPVLREVHVPAASLLVFYTDGVTENERKPLQGAAELREAAIFAANFSALPTADVIEKQMFLTGSNIDDAAILTAWTPPAPGALHSVPKVAERPF